MPLSPPPASAGAVPVLTWALNSQALQAASVGMITTSSTSPTWGEVKANKCATVSSSGNESQRLLDLQVAAKTMNVESDAITVRRRLDGTLHVSLLNSEVCFGTSLMF